MEKFVAKLRQSYPSLTFVEGEVAHWSPASQQISYRADESESSLWTILHELGHALEAHSSYLTDVDLLKKEVEAWTKAKQIGSNYGVLIDTEYIEECLDSYRDWLHKRSACPQCELQGIQQVDGAYTCLNCAGTWIVGSSRFCRPYRLKKAQRA